MSETRLSQHEYFAGIGGKMMSYITWVDHQTTHHYCSYQNLPPETMLVMGAQLTEATESM